MKSSNRTEQFIQKLDIMLRSRMATWVVTNEEERFFRLLREIVQSYVDDNRSFKCYSWSISDGLINLMPNMMSRYGEYDAPVPVTTFPTEQAEMNSLLSAFDAAKVGNKEKMVPVLTFEQMYAYAQQSDTERLFIIKDVHHLVDSNRPNYPIYVRRLKDFIFNLRAEGSCIIFLSPVVNIPTDLENDIQTLDMPRPTEAEIEDYLNNAIVKFKSRAPDIDVHIPYRDTENKVVKTKYKEGNKLKEKIIFNLRGLTETEITQTLSYSCVKNYGITVDSLKDIRDTKRNMIEKTGYLEFIPTPETVAVGGHDALKRHIDERGLYLDKYYREKYALKPPKGVLMAGIPGCGKTAFAKYIAWQWSLPLIRIDIGAIFGQYLGQSESRLRDALKLAESNAPCLLFIDEAEKALGGGQSHDSGTTRRVFGKMLTWLAERQDLIYFFCTANDIGSLPPEFMRSGRFDDVYYCDLPLENECKDILRIHLRNNAVDISDDDIAYLAKVAVDKELTGADIELSLINAKYKIAQADVAKTPLEPVRDIIVGRMNEIIPHAKRHAEQLLQNRLKALSEFRFTSDEAFQKISDLVKKR